MPSDDAIPKIDHDFQPLQDGVQLGSMIHFRRLFDHLLRAAKPKMICEIGIEGGIVSDFLVARAGEIGARYVGIDPFLSQSVAHRLANPSVEFHTHRSLDVLPRLPCPDFTIIDGDHNYYTVMGELRLLREAWRREGEPQNPDSHARHVLAMRPPRLLLQCVGHPLRAPARNRGNGGPVGSFG